MRKVRSPLARHVGGMFLPCAEPRSASFRCSSLSSKYAHHCGESDSIVASRQFLPNGSGHCCEATHRAAPRRITPATLFRDAAAIENLRKVDVLIVDKTGTLTEGRPAFERAVGTTGYAAATSQQGVQGKGIRAAAYAN